MGRAAQVVMSAMVAGFGALCGLVVGVIVVLNLNILAGLEDGYASTPRQVLDMSALLALAEIMLLIAGPVLGALIAVRLQSGTRQT